MVAFVKEQIEVGNVPFRKPLLMFSIDRADRLPILAGTVLDSSFEPRFNEDKVITEPRYKI